MLLYQYRRGIDDEAKLHYFVNLIKAGAMKFSKPSEFNDPFDCFPTQVSELPIGELPHSVVDALNRGLQNAYSEIIGIACLTAHPDRMLMWSHYGDQHRSVCVGFDPEELLRNSPTNSEGSPLYTEIRKVEYGNRRSGETDTDFIFKKSIEWAYEDEYRIVSIAKKGYPQWGPGVWNVPVSSIKEVILGARINQKWEKRIVDAVELHCPAIEIKKATIHSHNFEIVIERLADQPSVGRMSGHVLGPNGNWIRT